MKTPSTWVWTKSKFCSLDLERLPPPETSTFAPGDHFHFFVGEDEGVPFLLCNFDVLGLPMLLCNLWLSAFEKWFVLTFIQNWIYEDQLSLLLFDFDFMRERGSILVERNETYGNIMQRATILCNIFLYNNNHLFALYQQSSQCAQKEGTDDF